MGAGLFRRSSPWSDLLQPTPFRSVCCAPARDLLHPVYDSFTEGLETQDLKDAKALRDELA